MHTNTDIGLLAIKATSIWHNSKCMFFSFLFPFSCSRSIYLEMFLESERPTAVILQQFAKMGSNGNLAGTANGQPRVRDGKWRLIPVTRRKFPCLQKKTYNNIDESRILRLRTFFCSTVFAVFFLPLPRACVGSLMRWQTTCTLLLPGTFYFRKRFAERYGDVFGEGGWWFEGSWRKKLLIVTWLTDVTWGQRVPRDVIPHHLWLQRPL